MATEIATLVNSVSEIKPEANGLMPLLQTRLTSSALNEHKADLVVLLDAMSMKLNRYGWRVEGERNVAQQETSRDWAEALCSYPLDEVRDACRAYVLENPDAKAPNEGHVKGMILKKRAQIAAKYTPPPSKQTPSEPPATPEAKARILVEADFNIEANLAKGFPKVGEGVE